MKAVEGLLDGGWIEVNKAKHVVYLVMKFQGEMEVEGLAPERREELKQEAIERYKKDFGMVNMYVLPLSADEVGQ